MRSGPSAGRLPASRRREPWVVRHPKSTVPAEAAPPPSAAPRRERAEPHFEDAEQQSLVPEGPKGRRGRCRGFPKMNSQERAAARPGATDLGVDGESAGDGQPGGATARDGEWV